MEQAPDYLFGPEPWSSGNGRRLICERSWVQISAKDNRFFSFLHVFVVQLWWCLKRPKNTKKRSGMAQIKKIKVHSTFAKGKFRLADPALFPLRAASRWSQNLRYFESRFCVKNEDGIYQKWVARNVPEVHGWFKNNKTSYCQTCL